MKKLAALLCLLVVTAAAWMRTTATQPSAPDWTEVLPGVLRSPGLPGGYALVDGSEAILIDGPHETSGLAKHGVKTISGVYLTSYHRPVCAQIGSLLEKKVPVHAPKAAQEWLSPEGVRKYWRESLPLRNSRTAYLVVPVGFDGIRYTLADGAKITWRGWELTVMDTPGHARAHVALSARRGQGQRIAFTGGAFAAPGKLWAPYTTDWDHWTDAGLVPAAKSLRRLAEQRPDLLCPAYGPIVSKNVQEGLSASAAAVEEVGFLKSFERFTKKRLGNPPAYRFLTKEQAESNGSKPWSQVSEHLYVTGNTYVLVSKDNACLMIDPWDKRSIDQLDKLRKDKKLGPLEVVTFSHAHYDHYDGIYHLPDRDNVQVWTLDLVARPLANPNLLRAPFLDARAIRFDKTPRAGETLTWREYRFRFDHLPGQTEFTMGVETVIDGKKCYFTADNFFHQDMFSGSGGWMGLNRSFPPLYALSAQKVLDAAPDWVLAEHGGPFEFNAEDFRRRVLWGREAAKAADALSPSGNHLHDWNPHRVRIEPLVQKARPGATVSAELVIDNPHARPAAFTVTAEGRGYFKDRSYKAEVGAGKAYRTELGVTLSKETPPGRHVFPLVAFEGTNLDSSDAFFVLDVAP